MNYKYKFNAHTKRLDKVLDASASDWQDSVLSKTLTTPPGLPSTGDRYLIITGDVGTAWEGHNNEIAEWTGAVPYQMHSRFS